VPAIEQHAGAAGLAITARRRLGEHYARTLRLWREGFTAAVERVTNLGFDETFRRVWEYYLAYCEAGFRAHYLDVWQFRLTRA
jgi:cyclopropane-fatty-acyl-phospholipid synthase